LREALSQNMRSSYARDLPFEELLFDRWERSQSLGFGDQTSIYQSSHVFGDVEVGESTWIGPFTMLDGSGGLRIGDFCSISTGVQIYTHDTVKWAVSGGKAAYEKSPVVIGHCCYIGPQSVITRGVTIGDHCIIGAGSLVTKDIPPYTLAFGVPAKPRGKVHISLAGEVSWTLDETGERRR
jgi:acetyltransferase-like isoleucine patch superfamily enzyme